MIQIENYENYSATSDGKIFSTGRVAGRSGKGFSTKVNELKQSLNATGYHMVTMYNSTEQRTRYVHRLVAAAYLPNPDNLPQVNHIDGNKSNNSITNLEWCTIQHNNQHALATGLRVAAKGEDNSMAKLSEAEAIEIIHYLLEGLSNIEIASIYELHDRYVSLIRGKKRWKYLWEREFPEDTPPISCRKRTKRFNAQRLSNALLTEEASRVDSSESKREDS